MYQEAHEGIGKERPGCHIAGQNLARPSGGWWRKLTAFVLVLFGSVGTVAAADWFGEIPSGTTWPAGAVQRITGNATVAAGSSLTIQSGAIVKFNFGVSLIVEGTLNASGSSGSRILFTSDTDDTGGDTNGDGNASAPVPGSWNRLLVASSGAVTLTQVDIRYGGDQSFGVRSSLEVNGGELVFNDGSVDLSDSAGIRILSADPVIAGVSFQGNLGGAMRMNVDSDPAISAVSFTNNGVNGVSVDGGTLSLSRAWDDPDTVYSLAGDVTVPDGLTLTVGAGQVIKPNVGVDLFVNGVLDVNGTLGSPVYFVASVDDSRGGDTNNDADANVPGVGWWNRINVSSTGSATLDQTHIAHGGDVSFGIQGALVVDGGSLAFNGGSVDLSDSAGIRILSADPVIAGVSFQGNLGGAMRMNVDSDPAISAVSFTNNGVNGVSVDGGTLSLSRAWDDPDTVYSLAGDVTVPDGLTLTVGAGQVIKPNVGVDLFVNGALDVNGTLGSPVYFVASVDDSRGGDTNNDADANVPGVGWWNRINVSSTGSATLDQTHIAHGGDVSFGIQGALVVDGGSLAFNGGSVDLSDSAGIRILSADPVIAGVSFQDNRFGAMQMNVDSDPAISAVSFTNNGANGVSVDGGTLSLSRAWDDPDTVYSLAGDVTVPDGLTLTVGAGQVIKPNVGVDLFVNGVLDVNGTLGSPVYFVASVDDSRGGDTNNDADANVPGVGWWNRINVSSTGSATLDQTHIAHGGDVSFGIQGALVVDGGSLAFNGGSVDLSDSAGIRILSADPVIAGVSFQGNLGGAMRMNVDSGPAISAVIFSNNGVNGLALDGGTLGLSRTWDDPDAVYYLTGDVTVPEGLTLTVGAGQIVKPNLGIDLFINGVLDVNGTLGSPVYFVASVDDSRGGDTNNDGSGSVVSTGWWNKIDIGSTGSATLDHAHIAHGGDQSFGVRSSLEVNGGSLAFNGGSVDLSDSAGIRILSADPVIAGVSFQGNLGGAMRMNVDSDPAISAVSFSNNGVNGVSVDGGTLSLSRAWDDPDTVYSLAGDVTVPEGLTLTVGAGQVIKPNLGVDLFIDGVLDANGTSVAPVIFTASVDDANGGDTNNDGTGSSVSTGWWNRINIGATGNASLAYTQVSYAGDASFGTLAALVVDGGELVMTNGVVSDSDRRGIYAANGGSVQITNSLVFANLGSGLETSASTLTALNNTIAFNQNGVRADGPMTTLTNNIIANNSRAGVEMVGGAASSITYNDVYNPTASLGNYAGVSDPTATDGNISADPIFANGSAGLFQLLSSSPAIDAATSAGAPATDFFDNGRFDDPGIENLGGGPVAFYDIGAIERQQGSDPINLVLDNVEVTPGSGEIGDTVTISWRVRNLGTGPAAAPWSDGLFASGDDQWDINDQRLEEFEQTTTLFPGEFYTQSVDVKIPPALPGEFNFIIRADYRQQVREVNENNDVPAIANVTMPIIPLGGSVAATLTAERPQRYFQIPIGEELLYNSDGTLAFIGSLGIDLDDLDDLGQNELYVARSAIPVRENVAANAPAADQSTTALLAEPSNFIALARVNTFAPGSSSADIEMSAAISPFGITQYEPTTAGNLGLVTLRLDGVLFTPGLEAQLQGPGGVVPAESVIFDSSELAYATFDLSGQPAGSYSVQVSQTLTYIAVGGSPVSGGFVEVPQLDTSPVALSVMDGGGPQLQFAVQLPSRVRAAREFEFEITMQNVGSNDAEAPLVLLESGDGVGFVDSDLGFVTQNGLLLVLAGRQGPPATVRPGQTETYVLKAMAPNQAGRAADIDLRLAELTAGGPDFAAWISALGHNPGSPVWQPVVADLEATFGTTWPQFARNVGLLLNERSEQSIPLVQSIRSLVAKRIAATLAGTAGKSMATNFATKTIAPSAGPPESRVTSTNLRRGLTGKQYLKVAPGTDKWRVPDCSFSNRFDAKKFVEIYQLALGARTALSPVGNLPDDHIDIWEDAANTNQPEVVYGLGHPVSDAIRENFKGKFSFSMLHHRIAAREAYDIINDELDEVGIDNASIPDFDIPLKKKPGDPTSGTATINFYFTSTLEGKAITGYGAFWDPFTTATNQFALWAAYGGMQGSAATVKNVQIVEGDSEVYVRGTIRYALIDRYEYDGEDATLGPDASFYDLEWCAVSDPAGFDNMAIVEKPFEFEYVPVDATDPDPAPLTPPTVPGGGGSTNVVGSFDPNDKVTVGTGNQGNIEVRDEIIYTIFFENDPVFASAPAQRVTITDTLDSNLDLNKFELVSFTFGAEEQLVPAGLKSYRATRAFNNLDGSPLNVTLSADLDATTGVATWVLDSIDPETGGAPAGIDDGFLPVNDQTGRGEGHVTFRIRVKEGTPVGTQIFNSADIVFDQNSPIVTPTTINTIFIDDVVFEDGFE